MTATITYLRENQLAKLKTAIVANLDHYLSGEHDWPAFFDGEEYSRQSSIEMSEGLASRIQMPTERDLMDKENCLVVYESLKNMTPQQAADERVWAYLTHFELWEYTQRRWELDREDREKAIKSIRTHYFVPGARGLIRDNAVSRLWWMGQVANRLKQHDSAFSAENSLEILLHQSDVRANLLERSSFAMSIEIFGTVMRWLKNSYEGDKILFERENFRQFMKHLNRKGGRVMLNALSNNQLDKLIADILQNGVEVDPANL